MDVMGRLSRVLMYTAVSAAAVAGGSCSSGEPAQRGDELAQAVEETGELAAQEVAFDRAFGELCYGMNSVPMETMGGRHYVTLSLEGADGGTEELRFEVDTAGNEPGLLLHEGVARRLGYDSAEALPRVVVIGGRPFELPKQASWYLHPEPSDPTKRAIGEGVTRKHFADGQLGAGFLGHRIVCVDPVRGTIAFGKPTDEVDAEGVLRVPILVKETERTQAPYPFVYGRFDEGRELGLVLGNGLAVSLLERAPLKQLIEANPSWPRAEGAAGDADMVAGAFPEQMVRANGLELTLPEGAMGERGYARRPIFDFPQLELLVVERSDDWFAQTYGMAPFFGPAHGALGNDFLDRFRYVIDYRGQNLYLAPVRNRAPLADDLSMVGMSIAFNTTGCPVIKSLTSTNAPTVREKLSTDDVILAIDGENACEMEHHEIVDALQKPSGQEVEFLVRRGPMSETVVVPTAKLLRPRKG